VSITLVEGDRARTAAFTGSIAVQLDERQYESGFGPCLGAASSGQTIRTRTEDPDNPYPDFARACQRSGMQHTLSVAMPVPGRVVGALNLYSAGDEPFSDESETIVGSFAGYAAVTLANAALYTDAVDLANQLRIAMESRSVIEQAKGIVMAQNGCGADEAFTALARLSQTRNVKLRELAQDVVQRANSRGRQHGR
jgi:GAF domain-containing protein